MGKFYTLAGVRVADAGASTLGARLVRARLEYGSRLRPPRIVTQLEVGEHLGVSGVAVGGWEADRNEPGLARIKRLADLYGVRVAWLAFGDEPMRDERPVNHAPTPPMDAFRPITTGDDLQAALGEPRAKKRRGGDAG